MSRAVGVDLGADALRGVVLDNSKGVVRLISAGVMPLGDIARLEEGENKRLVVAEKLKELVRIAGLKAPQRRVGVAGKGVQLRYLMVPPVPPWRLELLAKFEAEHHAANEEAQAFDYRILDVPETNGQYTVLVGCLDERIALSIEDASKQSRLGEAEVELEALALYSAYFHGHGFEPDKTVLVVDVGLDSTTAVLIRNGSMFLARSVESCGKKFTDAISEALMVGFEEAEELKKTLGEITFVQAPPGGGTARIQRPGGGGTLRLQAALSKRKPGAPGAPANGGTGVVPPPPKEDAPAIASSNDTSILSAPPEVTLMDIDTDWAPTAPAPEAPKLDELSLQTPGTTTVESPVVPARPGVPVDAASLSALAGASSSANAGGSGATPSVPVDSEALERKKRQIFNALFKEAAALCSALEQMVAHCKNTYKIADFKVDTVYVCGGGSKLKGLNDFLGRRLRADVKPLKPLQKIDLTGLPPELQASLQSEDHKLAVATGLALSSICTGTFTFNLIPNARKESKEFWARGAFLYAAGIVMVLALTLFWMTPWLNKGALDDNAHAADESIAAAKTEQVKLDRLRTRQEEMRLRKEQIEKNSLSGDFFYNMIGKLKESARIPANVYLISISTSLPRVVLGPDAEKELPPGAGENPAGVAAPTPELIRGGTATTKGNPKLGKDGKKLSRDEEAPDTFSAQATVYLRGFVRAGQKEDLLNQIVGDPTKGALFKPGFADLLVPHPENPDHPDNLFKDIRLIWIDPDDNPQGSYFLKEFVLEAYVDKPQDEPKAQKPAPKAKQEAKPSLKEKAEPTAPVVPPKVLEPASPVVPALAPKAAEPAPPVVAAPLPAPAPEKAPDPVAPPKVEAPKEPPKVVEPPKVDATPDKNKKEVPVF